MFQLIVFGTGYYVDPTLIPEWVFHKLNYYFLRYGENLDTSAPFFVRHKANFLLRKFVPTQF